MILTTVHFIENLQDYLDFAVYQDGYRCLIITKKRILAELKSKIEHI